MLIQRFIIYVHVIYFFFQPDLHLDSMSSSSSHFFFFGIINNM